MTLAALRLPGGGGAGPGRPLRGAAAAAALGGGGEPRLGRCVVVAYAIGFLGVAATAVGRGTLLLDALFFLMALACRCC